MRNEAWKEYLKVVAVIALGIFAGNMLTLAVWL